jgi:hypothetical protein
MGIIMRDKDNILSAYDTCSTHAEWIRKVSEALGMCYDYDGPFVAAESNKVVEYICAMKEELQRLNAHVQ